MMNQNIEDKTSVLRRKPFKQRRLVRQEDRRIYPSDDPDGLNQ